MRRVWRIATDTPDYTSDDLTGAGAKATGGRWNRAGNAVLYCAETPSLACLETLVHLDSGGLPLNRYLVAIDIPADVWKKRDVQTAVTLAVGWDAIPHGMVSLDFGTNWLLSKRSAILTVPSAIVPEDAVVLVNPMHVDARAMIAVKLRKWTFDSRFRTVPLPKLGAVRRKP
ncbi:RES family NAD+ phosphorylase [Rhodoferax sp.]|uniref:RES family NAD+ phosphorylase n=1 Tax=Rhodoferax sp. TaxID=50421 RepID=UPI002761CBCF|nr:RES family NAD+ phosphorylase [Rhodoferax sp.]